MSLNELKLEFLKRVLLDCVDRNVIDTFFATKEYPSPEVMESCINGSIPEDRLEGKDWPAKAHTMIGLKRLNNLHDCLSYIRDYNIKGDFIETGVWRGGSCIFMQMFNKLYGMNRKVYVADSFRGLPPPDSRYSLDNGDMHHTFSELSVSKKDVENNFRLYDALDENVVFLEGWFKDTLNTPDIKELSLLRLDGDMYGSTIDAITALYDKLQPSGVLIVDDYALKGCAAAIQDFRKARNITTDMKKIDSIAVFWVKE